MVIKMESVYWNLLTCDSIAETPVFGSMNFTTNEKKLLIKTAVNSNYIAEDTFVWLLYVDCCRVHAAMCVAVCVDGSKQRAAHHHL